MTDKPRDKSDSDTGYQPASSPYDQPTEQIDSDRIDSDHAPAEAREEGSPRRLSDSQSTHLPRTADELDHPRSGLSDAPTTQMPAYRKPDRSDGPYSNDPTAAMGRTHVSEPFATPASEVVPPAQSERDDYLPQRRGTTDLGLLVFRLAVGGIFVAHGLQKLTGIWNGPGIDGFQRMLEASGFQQAHILAILGSIGETAGGVLLVLGLATPLAGAAVLAVIIDAWCLKQSASPGLQFFAPTGIEYESLLAAGAAALILTGPGRIALDGRRGWATRPAFGSFAALVVGAAAGVCIWIFLNGANPLV